MNPADFAPALHRLVKHARRRHERVGPHELADGLRHDADTEAFALLREFAADPSGLAMEPDTPSGDGTGTLTAAGRELLRETVRGAAVAIDRASTDAAAGTIDLLAVLLERPESAARVASWGVDVRGLRRRLAERTELPPLAVDFEHRPRPVAAEVLDAGRLRIVDANLNRLREGLRVLEDHVRFVLEDATLAAECKRLRHELRQAVADVGEERLLAARDTVGDVGSATGTSSEYARPDAASLLSANAKRTQEAARVLEEHLKADHPDAARAVERCRYRLYTLERQLLRRHTADQRLSDVRLYWLLDPQRLRRGCRWTIDEAVAGGVGAVQLRQKTGSDRERAEQARRIGAWVRGAGALFLLNDRADLAAAVGADGVHLGQDDLPARDARRLLGPDALIGLSTHDAADLAAALQEPIDYVGVGPTFPSRTKEFDRLAGLDHVRHVAAATTLPAFCIGGVDMANAAEVVAAGGSRLAVSAAISRADDPALVARTLCQRLA